MSHIHVMNWLSLHGILDNDSLDCGFGSRLSGAYLKTLREIAQIFAVSSLTKTLQPVQIYLCKIPAI